MEETIAPVKRSALPVAVDETRAVRQTALTGQLSLEKGADLLAVIAATAQLSLLALIVKVYRIEARPFRVVFALACCGFVVHHFLPRKLKLPFFVLLSAATMAVALGAVNALMVIGTGLVLLAICHLPIPWGWRIAGLCAATATLAAMRLQLFSIPQYSAVLTILGSIFMFRLIVYVYDVMNGVRSSFWQATAYFFMMPNPCFPLFPIVDYATFVRTAHAGQRAVVYQSGLRFIFRGILHLLLLRFLNGALPSDINQIATAGGVFVFMIAMFSSYLKVSGTFHIIIGILHLFEFNLPRTHHNYLLSASFTDFWRRTNIYWKDFIQKIVFYPIFVRLKKLGPVRGILLSTAIAMVISWALHVYQWFWLKGVVQLSAVDMAFWGMLGSLLTVNTWYEARFSRRRAKMNLDRSVSAAIMHGLKTSGTMAVIVVLWSLWSTDSFTLWFDILAKGANCSVSDLAMIVGGLSMPGIIAAAIRLADRDKATNTDTREVIDGRWLLWHGAPIFTGAAALLLIAQPALQSGMGATFASVASRITSPRMSQQGNNLMEQGYYENLTNAARLNPELAALYAQTPPDWPGESPVRPTKDWMISEVTPSGVFKYYRKTVTTNRWGMRDREYDQAKPAGTFRIGLFGESHTFGNGVEDNQVYKQLVEDRINQSGLAPPGQRVEIMNFSTAGYGPISKFASLKKKGFAFDLDVVIQTAVSNEKEWAIRNLTGAAMEGLPIPFPYLAQVVEKAGVTKNMTPSVINYRISPYGDEMIRWVYAELAKSCREHGVRPYLLFLPKPENELSRGRAYKELADIAQSQGIGVLDISDAYDSAGDLQALWVAPWDNHPNARGHQLLADALIRVLQTPAGRELLKPRDEANARPTQ